MSIKANVRQRRRERLREIAENGMNGRRPPEHGSEYNRNPVSGARTGDPGLAEWGSFQQVDRSNRNTNGRHAAELPPGASDNWNGPYLPAPSDEFRAGYGSSDPDRHPRPAEAHGRQDPDGRNRARGFEGNAEQDNQMNDPEYVWKQKQQNMEWTYSNSGDRHTQDHEQRWKEWNAPPTGRQFKIKLLLCGVLFAAVWGVFQLKTPWAFTAQNWVRQAMTRDMDFTTVEVWYQRYLHASPSLIPAFGRHPASYPASLPAKTYKPAAGKIIQPYTGANPGVLLQTPKDSQVKSFAEGWVITASNLPVTGFTVKIRHPGGWVTTYGDLGKSFVRVNDWVKGGEVIGNVTDQPAGSTGRFYFAIQKGSQSINPTDVISFG